MCSGSNHATLARHQGARCGHGNQRPLLLRDSSSSAISRCSVGGVCAARACTNQAQQHAAAAMTRAHGGARTRMCGVMVKAARHSTNACQCWPHSARTRWARCCETPARSIRLHQRKPLPRSAADHPPPCGATPHPLAPPRPGHTLISFFKQHRRAPGRIHETHMYTHTLNV
jgi:hypothetical protein